MNTGIQIDNYMKKLFLLIAVMSIGFISYAQNKDHITWKFESKKKAGNEYSIIITATVDKPWHLYSQNSGKEGPIPTSFSFKKNPLISLSGKTLESGKQEKSYDDLFKTQVIYYNNTVVFTQTVKLKTAVKTTFSGTVDYMLCNDKECTPPTKKNFDITL